MIRNSLFRLALPAVVTTALMVGASPALAQHGGGHGGGGFHAGGGFRPGGFSPRGFGTIYHAGYGNHYGFQPYNAWRGYRSYSGYGHFPGYGYIPAYSYGYSPSFDSLSYPAYDSGFYTYPPAAPSIGSDVSTVQSSSTTPEVYASPSATSDTAHVTVRLPDNANLWFNGTQLTGTGPVREFTTPPLSPGQTYSYEIRAHWTDNGDTTERKRTVVFAPGDNVELIFPALGAATATTSR